MTATAPRRSSTSVTGSRCTCRKRSGTTATRCSRCSPATGSSAAPSRASIARRGRSNCSARGAIPHGSTSRSRASASSSAPSGSCAPGEPCRASGSGAAAVDQLDSIVVGVAHEAEKRTALAHAVGLALRLDALLLQLRERLCQVIDSERNVPVPRAHLVRPPVVIEGELELLLLVGHPEEVVRRLLLAAADDVHVATELEPERLVEGAALLRIGDPVHGVQIAGHAPESCSRSSRRSAYITLSTHSSP